MAVAVANFVSIVNDRRLNGRDSGGVVKETLTDGTTISLTLNPTTEQIKSKAVGYFRVFRESNLVSEQAITTMGDIEHFILLINSFGSEDEEIKTKLILFLLDMETIFDWRKTDRGYML